MTASQTYKVQNWVVILLINVFLGLGAWQMNRINNTLEKLNNSAIEITGVVNNMRGEIVGINKHLDKHDNKFEEQEKNIRSFYEQYDFSKIRRR